MRLKLDAIGRDPAQFGQRKHLKAAAIGQDRSIPTHEPVQSARLLNHIQPGPNHKVVRVAEDNLRTECTKFGRRRRLRADSHECRRFHRAVGRCQAADTGGSLRVGVQKFER